MENATEALYMAFAVAIFAIALTLTMSMFSQAKSTSDTILYRSDETNFMEFDSSIGHTAGDRSRIVGLETIVPTLFKYYKENYTVLFKKVDGDRNAFIANPYSVTTKPLEIYKTARTSTEWLKDSSGNQLYTSAVYNSSVDDTSQEIYSFDLDEETKRNEPWTANVNYIKENLKTYLNGGNFE